MLLASCLLGTHRWHTHRRRKRGAGGRRTRPPPPSFKLGGIAPPTLPTVYYNELHCSIVPHLCQQTEGKMSSP